MTGDKVAMWLLMFGNRPVFFRDIRDLFGEEYSSWVTDKYIREASRPANAARDEWIFYKLAPKALALLK